MCRTVDDDDDDDDVRPFTGYRVGERSRTVPTRKAADRCRREKKIKIIFYNTTLQYAYPCMYIYMY